MTLAQRRDFFLPVSLYAVMAHAKYADNIRMKTGNNRQACAFLLYFRRRTSAAASSVHENLNFPTLTKFHGVDAGFARSKRRSYRARNMASSSGALDI